MKICVPSKNDRGLDSGVHGHFGSAPFYVVINTEDGHFETVPNRGHRHQHVECNPAEHIGPHRVDAVICRGMGRRAFSSLDKAGIKVYASDKETVREVLAAVREDTLAQFKDDELCMGHHRGNQCQ